jgi:acetolactate synthase-1/2/3 large subunit
MQSIAEIIAGRLAAAGVRHAFGIPGGEVLALVAALEGAGIRFVLTKHENAAGFMAEGAHHRTGAPGVLVATLGPGVANAVNVVANAQQDRVPLIFLTGAVDPAEALTYTHQVFDHGALLRPICKASLAATPGGAAALIEKALEIATTDPWGPVHIDVPIAAATHLEAGTAPRPSVRGRAAPAAEALAEARSWLAAAERPLILAGIEAVQHGAAPTIRAVARRLRAPVLASYKAKGVLPEDDPLALGGAGLSPVADRVLKPLLRKSDCVLLVGYDPIEMRSGWREPFAPGQRVVELVATPVAHGMHRADLSFVCDPGSGLAALADGVESRMGWRQGELDEARAALARAFRTDEEWGPAAVVDTVRRALPREAVATCDSGAHRILLSQVWRCYEPGTLLQSTGLCTMGCALPLAMGAALADGRPVVAFTGDAGLEMVLGELATLRDLALPVIVVVFVDASLALIELKQRSSKLPNAGVDFGATDWVAVGRAMGGAADWIESRAALETALREALARPGFSLLACRIGRAAYDGRI